MDRNKKLNMHLVFNTHWDREWRWGFRETQMRLKFAMDLLLDTMEKDPRYKSFLTDSQASMMDDYLDICPEKKEQVEKFVKEGRLQIGPWYTLPAEFLVSGESLVRNLTVGHKIAKALGGVMKAGYNIFSWGQVSQLPQIYRGFGMDTVMFYRGIDKTKLDSLEFWWEAPNGERSLGVTFGAQHRLNFWVNVYKPWLMAGSAEGYDRKGRNGFLTQLCDNYSEDRNHHLMKQCCYDDKELALKGMEKLIESLEKEPTNELLFLQGFDLENPDPRVTDLIDYINENIDYGKINITTMPEYLDTLKKALIESGKDKELPVIKSEMLEVEKISPEFGPLYAGVWSARMPYKLKNAETEIRLTNWAEPAAVWSMLRGEEYPQRPLYLAWKTLCQNQQHDGIGGCHVDRVTLSSMERFAEVNDISEGITRAALKGLVAEIDFSSINEDEIGLVVFNPLAYAKSEVVEAFIDMPVISGDSVFKGGYVKNSTIEIYDGENNRIPVQIIDQRRETMFAYRTYGGNTNFKATRFRVAIEAKNIPAFGYRKYKVVHKNHIDRYTHSIASSQNTLENEYIKASIGGDGSITLKDKITGEIYPGLHYFEDGGEQGGPLIYTPPALDEVYNTIGSSANISLVISGPLLSTYRIEREWLLPKELKVEIMRQVPNGSEWMEPGRFYRSKDKGLLRIVTEVTLRKGSRLLEFKTLVDNGVKDHRLRVVFPTGIITDEVLADSPYDVVKRQIGVPDSSGWLEEALKTYPSNSFVDLCKDNRGLSIIHQGIPEYEVFDNEDRSIALTLLRSFGVAGGGAETFREEPLAQCLGVHEFRYAVYPHKGGSNNADIFEASNNLRVPVRISQCSAHEGKNKEESFSFFAIENKNLVVTALKKAEEDNSVIIRGFNPTNEVIDTKIYSGVEISGAYKVNLEEIELMELVMADNSVNISVTPGEIFTVKILL